MDEFKNILSLKDQFTKIMADYIIVSVEDLQPIEKQLIDKSFEMFSDKLEDIKVANGEIKRLSLELANIKSMGTADNLRYEEKSTGICPICGRDDSFRADY